VVTFNIWSATVMHLKSGHCCPAVQSRLSLSMEKTKHRCSYDLVQSLEDGTDWGRGEFRSFKGGFNKENPNPQVQGHWEVRLKIEHGTTVQMVLK